MDLNKRIADIAGWTEISTDPKIRQLRPIMEDSRLWGLPPKGLYKPWRRRLLPDYRAPENLHELVRVAMQTANDLDGSLILKYRAGESKYTAIIIGKGRGDSNESLSHALAEAIIEAKG